MSAMEVGSHSGLAITPLSNWLETEQTDVMWDQHWTEKLQCKDKEALHNKFTELCFSVLDLSDKEQVFIARTFFISVVTDIIRTQSRKGTLQPQVLYKSYQTIDVIEKWENISEFILGIQWYLDVIIDDLMEHSPIIEECAYLDKAFWLINEHLRMPHLTVKWLSEQLGISTTHLSNLFKLKLGETISEYIAKKKMKEIVYEMIHTSKPLKDIREAFGFRSHSHFIQFFKKHKGQTPLKYRENILHAKK